MFFAVRKVATIIGHGAARFAITAAWVALLTPLLFVGSLTLFSLLDVALTFIDVIHLSVVEGAFHSFELAALSPSE